MSLTNMLKDMSNKEVKLPTDSNSVIKSNLRQGLEELSGQFLENVKSGDIKIQDTKDLKDIATVFQMLDSSGMEDANHPQLTKNVANFFNMEFNTPEGQNPKQVDINKVLDNLDEDGIKEMIAKQSEALNKDNEESF